MKKQSCSRSLVRLVSIAVVFVQGLYSLSTSQVITVNDFTTDTGLNQTPGTVAKKLLCLTMCNGFVHGSIKPTVKMLMELGAGNGFTVDSTGSSANVSSANLAKYDAIAFNNTTGEFLNGEQKTAIETYVKSGKGVFAIHAATDAFKANGKTTWQFYADMVGAIFKDHPGNPNIRTATVKVENRTHLSTIHLPATLSLKDEWYNFYQNVRGVSGFNVLMSLDESTYNPDPGMGDHPIAWYHTFNTSRVIYTGIGHNDADLFKNQDVRNHFLGCVQYALGNSTTPVISQRSDPENVSGMKIFNRANSEIIISHNAPGASGLAKAQLLSLSGSVIQELPFTKISAGEYLATYGTSGALGHSVPHGVYIVSAVFGKVRLAQKVALGRFSKR